MRAGIPRAVAFDVMGTLFDLGALRERLRESGAPDATLEAWFGRTLHNAASLTLVGEFRPFSEIAAGALRTTLVQLDLDEELSESVLPLLGRLPAYPDARPALERLREAGVRTATLTNGGAEHTEGLLESAGLRELVDEVVTVAEVAAYKPHPAPYGQLLERLGTDAAATALVAAHGWDVLGARAAGLDAVWVERLERRWPFPVDEPPRAGDLRQAVNLLLGGASARAG